MTRFSTVQDLFKPKCKMRFDSVEVNASLNIENVYMSVAPKHLRVNESITELRIHATRQKCIAHMHLAQIAKCVCVDICAKYTFCIFLLDHCMLL